MKFKKLVFIGYTDQQFETPYWKRIDLLTSKKVFSSFDDKSLDTEITNADGILVKLGAKVPKELIDKAPNLKYIGMLGTGVGGIDILYAKKKKIAVVNVADYATEGVAEFTFGAIIDFLREIERAKKQAKTGDYSESSFSGSEIKNKNLGVIGLGNIGTRIALLAKAFGANVSYWSKNRKKDLEKQGITYKKIEDLLSESNILTLNLSLNPETEKFLDKSKLNLIKENTLLINTSPMELIDFNALTSALSKNKFNFILDHSDEMTPEDVKKIIKFRNCIVYPPIAYTTKEASALKKEVFVKNLENFLKGKPTNKVN